MTETKPRRRVWRWAKRLALGLLVLLVVAVVFVVIAARTDWGREQVRSRVEAQLQSTFPGGARVGRIEGNLLGRFTVHDIEVRDLAGKPAITVGTLEAELSLRALASKTALVETAIATDVKIAIGAARLTKPPDPASPPGEPSSWSVELPEVEVRNATLEVTKGYPIALDDIALTGEVDIQPGEPLAATLAVKGMWRERAQALDIQAKVEIGAEVLIKSASGTLGGAQLAATDVVVDATQPSGQIEITATVAQISALVPGGFELPVIDDLALHIQATPPPLGQFGTQLEITGFLGTATVNGAIRADLGALSASGFVGVGATDLEKLTRGKVSGHGEAALALAVDRSGAKGIVGVRGQIVGRPEGSATIIVDASFLPTDRVLAIEPPIRATGGAEITVLAATGGDVQAATTATVAWSRGATTHAWLDRARAVATATDLAPAAKIAATGALRAEVELTKQAPLVPVPAFEVKGKARAVNARYEDVRVGTADTTFAAKLSKASITGTSRTLARRIVNEGELVGDADVDATLLADRRIYTRVTARPVAAELEAFAAGHVTIGDNATTIALDENKITPKRGAIWAGRGGTVVITDDKVTVRDFRTGNSDGFARADVTFVRSTRALDVAVDAQKLPATAIDPAYRGTVSGKLVAKQRGLRWDGEGTFVADQLWFDPEVPVLDGDGRIELRGRALELKARVASREVGEVHLQVALEAPRDVLDPIAWKRLERKAIRVATITIDKLDLATIAPTGGRIQGKLDITGTETKGKLDVKGVETVVGTAEGELVVEPFLGKHIGAVWNARVTDLGEGNVVVQVKVPDYPFDPLAWKQLGRNALMVLSANFEDVVVDPGKLAKLGVDAKYTGRAHLNVKIAEGASVGIVTVAARGITGELIAKPIDVHVVGRTDERGTTATACVVRPGESCPEEGGIAAAAQTTKSLVDIVDVTLPITFGTWISAPKTALAAKLSGKLVVPKQSAPAMLAILGRKDFDPNRGTAEGTITVAGTLGAPTASGAITMRNLDLLSAIAGRDIPELVELTIGGTWDAKAADIKLLAVEKQGRLSIETHVDPKRLGEARAAIAAVNVELAPLAAFLPGELAAASGRLRGNLRVASFDLSTMEVRGNLDVEQAYVPITPMIGTLRDGRASLAIKDSGITLDVHGLLNTCRDLVKPNCTENVTLKLKAPNDVTRIDGDMVVSRIAPLAEIEPIMNGKAHIALVRTGPFDFGGDITISDGYVFVPPRAGDDLLDADDVPDDMFFVEADEAPPDTAFRDARRPTERWLVANVKLESTVIEVEEYDVFARVRSRNLKLTVGDTIGLDGQIIVEHGVANDVFGRQYAIRENAILDFDGTIDPAVALFMSYEFKAEGMTLTMAVEGRLSDDDFPNPRFLSNRSDRYSEGELFGFFLGGAPSGTSDATAAAREAAINAPTSLLSQAIAKRVKNILPKRLKLLDVIKCEPGTSTAGASCTVGRRFLDGRVYVSGKQRFVVLPNENPFELSGQYYLSTDWYFEGAGGSANILGADLFWRHRW